jgi:hypothetical protein
MSVFTPPNQKKSRNNQANWRAFAYSREFKSYIYAESVERAREARTIKAREAKGGL